MATAHKLTSLVCVLIAAAGCSDGGSLEEGEPPLGPVSVITNDAEIVLPLDAYQPPDHQLGQISLAEHMLAGDCMERFSLPLPPVSEPMKDTGLPRHGGLYWITSAEDAAKYGYGRPPGWDGGFPEAPPQPTSEAEVKQLTFAMEVLTGGIKEVGGTKVPAGGCLAEGARILAGVPKDSAVTPDSSYEFQQELSLQAGKRTLADSRAKNVFEKWSSCMKQRGFDYQNPREANNDKRWVRKESPLEIVTAKADVACKTETNLVGILVAIRSAYENRAIEKNEERLVKIRSLNEIRLRNAARALAGQPLT